MTVSNRHLPENLTAVGRSVTEERVDENQPQPGPSDGIAKGVRVSQRIRATQQELLARGISLHLSPAVGPEDKEWQPDPMRFEFPSASAGEAEAGEEEEADQADAYDDVGIGHLSLDLRSLSRSASQNSLTSLQSDEPREEFLKGRPDVAEEIELILSRVNQFSILPDKKGAIATQYALETSQKISKLLVGSLPRVIRQDIGALADHLAAGTRPEPDYSGIGSEPSKPGFRTPSRRGAVTADSKDAPRSGSATPSRIVGSRGPSEPASPGVLQRLRARFGKTSPSKHESPRVQSGQALRSQSPVDRKEARSEEELRADVAKEAAALKEKLEQAINPNKELHAYFRRFCEGEHSHENLTQLAKIDAYLRVAERRQPGDLMQAGIEVMLQALSENEVHEVFGADRQHASAGGRPSQSETNVSSSAKRELISAYQQGDAVAMRPGIEHARKDLLQHTEDTFKRFLRSELHRCFEAGIPLAPPLDNKGPTQ